MPRPVLSMGRSSSRSFVLGEPEVQTAVARIEPPAGDDLAARVEVDAFGAVRMAIAEEGVLPPAERVVGDGDGDGDVDPDHSHLDLVLEPAGRATVVGEDRGS